MVSVIVLMVSPPWGQSWRLAALSLLTINLSDQMIMLYFLRTELSMNLLEYHFQQTKCLACWSRNIIGIFYLQQTKCLACWSRPPDPKPESLLAADPRLSWAFRTLDN